MHSFHRLDNQKSKQTCRFAAWLIMSLMAAGCGSQRSTKDYVPASDQSRQAVELVLEAWKNGSTTDPTLHLANNGPKVQIFDTQWASGKKLTKFEIVRELPSEPGKARHFSVKLTFQGDSTDTETSYYVVGINPLAVFRDSEFSQASGGVIK